MQQGTVDRPRLSDYRVTGFRYLLPNRGGRADWHPTDDDLIAFDMWGPDTFHDVYLMRSDGSDIRCLTGEREDLPQRENADPEWHPSGEFIVFDSEEPVHHAMENRWFTHPGIGGYCNLWAIRIADGKVFKLTDFRPFMSFNDTGSFPGPHTVLHPHLNDDGSKVLWTTRYANDETTTWGRWKIMMADFVIEEGVPHLENIGDAFLNDVPGAYFVESMGFRPKHDDEIDLTANLDGQHEYGMDHYLYNWKTKEVLRNLTQRPKIWEEDTVFSHSGKTLVYQSSMAFGPHDPTRDWPSQPRHREIYLVNADDGSDHQQLTHFNVEGWLEYQGGAMTCVFELTMSPDGKRICVGINQDSGIDPSKFTPKLRLGLIELDRPIE